MSLKLSVWTAATGQLVHDVELTERLAVPTATIGRSHQGLLAIAPDDSVLYIAWENKVWTLSTDSLQETGEVTLPGPADGMALSTDGHELYLLPTTTGNIKNRIRGLWTVDTTGLKLIRHADDWPWMRIFSLLAAPAS